MPSIASLIDLVGDLSSDRRDVRLRARYAREAGFIPQSARNPETPQVETPHVIGLVAHCLVAGAQTNSPAAAGRLCRLPGDATPLPKELEEAFPGRSLVSFAEQAAGHLELMIDGYLDLRPGKVVRSHGAFIEAAAWQGRDQAIIAFGDGRVRRFFEPDPREPEPVASHRIDTITSVPAWVLERLATHVARTRMDARRLGITVATADAWRAIGVEPLGPPALPLFSGGPTARPKNAEVADEEPPSTATSGLSQPATSQSQRAKSHTTNRSDSLRTSATGKIRADRNSSKGDGYAAQEAIAC